MLRGCSRREAEADRMMTRREAEHEAAMTAISASVAATEQAAVKTETAAANLLRRLREDFPR